MKTDNESRRTWLKGALGATIVGAVPQLARADTPLRIRTEWQQFKTSAQYTSFRSAIASMRANTNINDRSSLAYWANVHVNHCPHGAPYFISWHRGYLYYFEQQLRIVSGDANLNLPYWDYYAYGTMPAEFTNPASNNPLYVERLGANVHQALDLAPFASTVFNFQHGTSNAFEPKIEDIHNPVHDLIGGVMGSMLSPLDPIFYLHHASVDRLTHAWALPDGKGIPYSNFPYSPADSHPYWAGDNVYASDLSIARYLTLDPTWIGVDYANTSVPTSLPPPPVFSPAEANRQTPSRQRPPFRTYRAAPPRRISDTRRSSGGVLQASLDEQSVSLRLRLEKKDAADIARIVAARRRNGTIVGAVTLVVDGALVAAAAERGGFFYALYLNMPSSVDTLQAREQFYIGTLGAFQIAAASHHGAASIEYDVSDLLARQKRIDFSELTLSWVRIDGDKPPAGKAIAVEEVRIDLSFDVAPTLAPAPAKPQGWYRRRV
jgi:tyrosinase